MKRFLFLLLILQQTYFSNAQNIGVGVPTPQEKLDVAGGIRLANTTNTNLGTIRYRNGVFEGYVNGNYWSSLAVPAGAIVSVPSYDTASLAQYGFSYYALQNASMRFYVGTFPGTWTNYTSTSSGLGANQFNNSSDAVWSGTEALVYYNNFVYRFNPSTNVWTLSAANTVGSFAARYAETTVWTGSEMIIFGGEDIAATPTTVYNNGVRYNPSTNIWTAIANAPIHRFKHAAVWTGTDMLVFGGDSIICATSQPVTTSNQVFKYNLAGNTWTGPLANGGTPPGVRKDAVAGWTGTDLLIYGGYKSSSAFCDGFTSTYYDTYSYTLSSSTWSLKATNFYIGASTIFSSDWDGAKFNIFSRDFSGNFANASFNPSANTWTAIPNENQSLCERAVWNGSLHLVFDYGLFQYFNPVTGFSKSFNPPTTTNLYLMIKN